MEINNILNLFPPTHKTSENASGLKLDWAEDKKNQGMCSLLTALGSKSQTDEDKPSRFISKQNKQSLIQLITQRNYTMKNAAKKLGISYSTAKKIYARFKRQKISKKPNRLQNEAKIASYSLLAFGQHPKIEIVSSTPFRIKEEAITAFTSQRFQNQKNI